MTRQRVQFSEGLQSSLVMTTSHVRLGLRTMIFPSENVLKLNIENDRKENLTFSVRSNRFVRAHNINGGHCYFAFASLPKYKAFTHFSMNSNKNVLKAFELNVNKQAMIFELSAMDLCWPQRKDFECVQLFLGFSSKSWGKTLDIISGVLGSSSLTNFN